MTDLPDDMRSGVPLGSGRSRRLRGFDCIAITHEPFGLPVGTSIIPVSAICLTWLLHYNGLNISRKAVT